MNNDIQASALAIMEKVNQSVDEVSTTLAAIFDKAVPHLPEELQRARDRKERGVPPGKHDGTIGDELSWEQILSRFAGKRRLWVISRDSDYGSSYNGKIFMNQVLYDELRSVSAGAEAFLFKDIPSGIKHFAEMTGVQAAKLPTSEQIEQIKKEEDVLPPIGWSTVTDDGAMAAFRKTLIQQGLVAAMPFSNSNAFPVGGIIRTPLSDSEAELKEA